MRDIFNDIPDGIKGAADILSFATLLGSLVSLLPAVASILTILWTTIRIYETETVQKLLGRKNKT